MIPDVLETMEALARFFETYNPKDQWSPNWLRQRATELKSAGSQEEQRAVLDVIEKMTRGGMGSLGDTSFNPLPDSTLSYAELNIQFGRLIARLYVQVTKALGQTS